MFNNCLIRGPICQHYFTWAFYALFYNVITRILQFVYFPTVWLWTCNHTPPRGCIKLQESITDHCSNIEFLPSRPINNVDVAWWREDRWKAPTHYANTETTVIYVIIVPWQTAVCDLGDLYCRFQYTLFVFTDMNWELMLQILQIYVIGIDHYIYIYIYIYIHICIYNSSLCPLSHWYR